jgi:hypothetical protein
MKFVHFDKEGGAHFSGRFVLSGLFAYGCEVECQGKITEDCLVLTIVPDPEVAARLPRWKVHDNDIKIYLTREAPLARAIATPKQKAALLSGKLPEIRGHIAVVVDDFQTAIECDSASYSARFVAIAKPPKRETKAPDGNYGCP